MVKFSRKLKQKSGKIIKIHKCNQWGGGGRRKLWSVFLTCLSRRTVQNPAGVPLLQVTSDHLGTASQEVNGRSLASGPCRHAEGQADNCPPHGPLKHWLIRRGEKLSCLVFSFDLQELGKATQAYSCNVCELCTVCTVLYRNTIQHNFEVYKVGSPGQLQPAPQLSILGPCTD